MVELYFEIYIKMNGKIIMIKNTIPLDFVSRIGTVMFCSIAKFVTF